MARTADERLEQAFEAFEPSAAQTARMARALEDAFERPPRSLAAEWVELLRIRPLWHGALAGASALLVFATPLGAALSLLRLLE